MRIFARLCRSRRALSNILLLVVSLWACLVTVKLMSQSGTFDVFTKSSVTLEQPKQEDREEENTSNLSSPFYERYLKQVPDLSCNKTVLPAPDDPVWLTFRWREKQSPRVIYNRVPKTGSSMVKSIIRKLSAPNKFEAAWSGVQVFFNVSIPIQEAFVQGFYRYNKPVVYDRHIYFVDFTRFGEPQPMYINTVRDPIPHYLSFYYFMRRQSGWKNRYTDTQRKMDLDQCLNVSLLHCEPHRQYRFFCGQDPICLTLTSEEAALAVAKRNIERYYAVVGLSEDLHGFFSTLEFLAPEYFNGAGDVYLKHKNDFGHFTSKRVQPVLKPETEGLLKSLLKYDYELYQFARQRFNKQKCLVENIRRTLPKTDKPEALSSPTPTKKAVKKKEKEMSKKKKKKDKKSKT